MLKDELEKKISIKNCSVWRQLQKNNKIKYPSVQQFKTQTMQTKHGIKNEKKIRG
jgi:prephenate dehydrogenase